MVDVLALPQLDLSTYPSQIFWLGICFSMLYLFVKRVYFPRIKANLDRRSAYIKRNRQDAESADSLSVELRATQDEKFGRDSSEASAIVSDAMRAAQIREQESRAQVRLRAVELLAQVEKDTADMVGRQRADIISWSARLAVGLYRKTTGNDPSVCGDELMGIVEGCYEMVRKKGGC